MTDLPTPQALAAPPDTRLSAMVFTRDPDADRVIRDCLANVVPSAQFISGTVDTAVSELAQRASPRLLLVDVSGCTDPVARVNSLAQVCEPGTGVIVIGDTNDIRLYRELASLGVIEYYFKPLVGGLIADTAIRFLSGGLPRRSAPTGKLLFVMGVRGDVGATTIATNAAWHLAETLQRRVVLLDLDLYAGDAALQLDAVPTHALREALEHPARVDDLFLDRAAIHATQRLSLLSSLESTDALLLPEEQAVLSLLEKLRRRYRYVVVDLPVEAARRLPGMLRLPGICLLVSNASLTSARDVARWRERLGANTPERQTLHILNGSSAHGALPMAEFTRAAGQAPDITIPYDGNIAVKSKMGVREASKCAALQRGLAPLFSLVVGEATSPAAANFRQHIARLLGRTR